MATDNIRIYTKPQYDGTISEFAKSDQIAPYWNAASSYSARDNVVLSGVLYISLVSSNVGNNPSSSPSKWFACNVFTPGYRRLCEDIVGQLPWSQQRHYSVNPNLHSNIAVKDGVVYACTENIVEGSAFNPSKWSSQYYPTTGGWLTATLRTSGTVSLCGQPLNLDTGNSMIGASSTGFAFATIEKVGNSFVNVSSFLDCSNNDLVSTELNSLVLSAPSWTKTSYGAGKFVKRNGALSVSKQQLTPAQSETAANWNAIDGAASMFSSSNTSLIRDALPSSEGYERVVTVGGVDIYAPSDVCSVVVMAVDTTTTEAVTGETVYVYEGSTATGTPLETIPYSGTPVSFAAMGGSTYCVSITNNAHRGRIPNSVVITPTASQFVTLSYKRVESFSELTHYVLPSFPSTSSADKYLVGTEISDTWTSENGVQYSDPMVCTAVKDYYDANNVQHRGAKMERKYASLHAIEYCTDVEWQDFGTCDESYPLVSLAYGNGRWVAIGENRSYQRADNATSWTRISTQLYGGACCVSYGVSGFVAVGRDSYTYYMNDGKSRWIAVTEQGRSFSSVAYGSGKWVAVANGKDAFYKTSNEGSWSPFGNFDSAVVSAVTYGGTKWVAVGRNGRTYYKNNTDTQTKAWRDYGTCGSGELKCVAYGNGKFVAAGADWKTYYRTDSMSEWADFGRVVVGGGFVHSICYANGRWVCAIEGGETFYKDDGGTEWKPFGYINGYSCKYLAYGNGRLVAVGGYGRTMSRANAILVGTSASHYRDSSVRQYLNSSATSGAWHANKPHGSEQPNPSNYSSIYGYRRGCSGELLLEAHPVKIPCQAPASDSASSYTVCDTFFLDSVTEKYGVRDSGAALEGTYDSYWKERTGWSSASNDNTAGRKVRRIDGESFVDVQLRSPVHSYTKGVHAVTADGGIGSNTSTTTLRRMTPCCVIW